MSPIIQADSQIVSHLELEDGTMRTRLTPPLSPEGIEEIQAELRNAPADTPQRRETFARARSARFLVEQVVAQAMAKKRR